MAFLFQTGRILRLIIHRTPSIDGSDWFIARCAGKADVRAFLNTVLDIFLQADRFIVIANMKGNAGSVNCVPRFELVETPVQIDLLLLIIN